MNVLQVVPELNAGGVEGTTIEIAQALRDAGHGAHIVSAGGRMESALGDIGAVLHRSDIGSKNILTVPHRINFLRHIIKQNRIDILHARSRAPAWPAFYAAKAEKIPFVTTYHGIYNANSKIKRGYNGIMAKGEVIIANSDYTKTHIIKTHGTDPARITTIHRGVDMARFDPARISAAAISAQRKTWGVDNDTKLILLPGRITRWKGQIIAIKALAELPANCVLVLLGDAQGRDDYVAELKARAKKLGLKARVIFADHSQDMPTALAAVDIVISASTDPEAFGRIAIEAQAMGRPVVASAHGGALETVKEGLSGCLTPPADSGALAHGIKHMLDWPDFNKEAVRARIANNFSTRALQLKTLALYKTLLI